MKEPSNGPSVKIANHHEAGVPFPTAETLAITVSVKRMIANELAMAHDHDDKNCIRDVYVSDIIDHR